MQYLIFRSNQQEGPYSSEVIRERLSKGDLALADMCWGEDLPGWAPIESIAEFTAATASVPPKLPPTLPAESSVRPSPSPPPLPKAAKTSVVGSIARKVLGLFRAFFKAIFEKAFIMTALTQKQVYRKKIEIIDLKRADCLSGKKAYEQGLLLPDDAESLAILDVLQQRLVTLRSEQGAPPVSSFVKKVTGAFSATARNFKIWRLASKQNRLFTKLGRKLRENPHVNPALSVEIGKAHAQSTRMTALNAEIVTLTSRTRLWERLVTIGIIVALIFVAFHNRQKITYVTSSVTSRVPSPFPVFVNNNGDIDAANSGTAVNTDEIADADDLLAGQNKMRVDVSITGDNDIAPSAYQSDIEASLRQAGITVLPDHPGIYPRLDLQIDVSFVDEGVGFSTRTYLLYTVQLNYVRLYSNHLHNRPEKYLAAVIWSDAYDAYQPALHSLAMRGEVDDHLTAHFIKAYKKANNIQ